MKQIHAFTSSPWGFRFYQFGDYCRFMASIGIHDLCGMFGDPAVWPVACRSERADAERQVRVAAEYGLHFIEMATTTGKYAAEIPLTAVVGAKYFRIVDGWQPSEGSFRQVTKELRETAKQAEDNGITIIIENHGGLLTTGANSRRFLEAIDRDSVRLNYDPANYPYYNEDPIAALDEVQPFVAFTHCKSLKYESGKPKYCRVSEGVIDYRRLFAKLLPDYQGYIGLEYEEASDAEAGTKDDLAYLRQVLGN